MLTPGEVEHLFTILRQMAAGGRGLVFISHKLHEVLALSDRVTVLRHGKVMGEVPAKDATRENLASMMVGRPVRLAPDKPPLERGKARLTIRDLTVMGDRGIPSLENLNLTVHEGEILGIAACPAMANANWLKPSPGCGRRVRAPLKWTTLMSQARSPRR